MHENPYVNSLELRLNAATPVELVVILYDAAIESVQSARRHLAEGRIAERSAAVTRAVEAITELSRSLDHGVGGELSRTLAGLYDYMQRALLEANFQQTAGGLEQTETLLTTLRASWAELAQAEPAIAPAPQPEALPTPVPAWGEPEEPVAYGLRQWSA